MYMNKDMLCAPFEWDSNNFFHWVAKHFDLKGYNFDYFYLFQLFLNRTQ